MNNKLLQLFHALNGVEKRALKKFLASPFFNQKEEVTLLWEYLLLEYPLSPTGFSNEKAFSKIYPHADFDLVKLRHAMTWLLQCIEEFLAYRQMQKDEFNRSVALAAAYRAKGLEKHFDHAMRQANKNLKVRAADQDYFWAKYRLEFEQYAFVESQVRTAGNNLSEVGRALDAHILASKLKQSCLQLAHQSVYKIEYDYSFLQSLLDFLEDSDYLKLPAIASYYYCYRALTEDDHVFFKKFKNELESGADILADRESRTLYLLAINFCIRQINQANDGYVEEAFDLYRKGTASGVLLENGHLSRFAYKNTVALGLSLSEFEWVENFIESFRPSLEKKYQEAFYHYNLARLYFSKKDYDKAMRLLVQVDDSDLLLNLDAKVMLLKMYFENGEFDALDSLLTSFRTMVNRKRMISYHKAHYLGVIRFTKKLMEIRPGDKKMEEKLQKEILETERLPEKGWLLQQLNAKEVNN